MGIHREAELDETRHLAPVRLVGEERRHALRDRRAHALDLDQLLRSIARGLWLGFGFGFGGCHLGGLGRRRSPSLTVPKVPAHPRPEVRAIDLSGADEELDSVHSFEMNFRDRLSRGEPCPLVVLQDRHGTEEDGGAPTSFDCASDELAEPLITNLVEFGLVFGGGLEMPVSRLMMQLDARYNLGLSNINGGPDATDTSVSNRGWSFTLGLGYPFG